MNKKASLFLIFALCAFINVSAQSIKTGAECTEDYFKFLEGKKIGIVANQSSLINNIHLVDSLKSSGFTIKKV